MLAVIAVMPDMAFVAQAQNVPIRPDKPDDPKPIPKSIYLRIYFAGELWDGNYNSLHFEASGGWEELKVSTNASTWTVENVPWWITVTGQGTSKITIQASKNDSSSSRTATFNVKAGGRRTSIKVVQEAASKLNVYDVQFGVVDEDGKILVEAGQPLYSSEIAYLSPKLYYNGGAQNETKTVAYKLYLPNGTLSVGSNPPSGYTTSSSQTFYPGYSNTRVIPGWGTSSKNYYSPGTYTFELYIDGVKTLTRNFEVKSTSLDIYDVKFGSVTENGSILVEYGGTLYSTELAYLKPKLYYNGEKTSTTKTVAYKILKPDGTLKRGSSSPSGYTYSDSETFYPGTANTVILTGWGNEKKTGYPPGTYTFELYVDGVKKLTRNFEVKRKSTTTSTGAKSAEVYEITQEHNVYQDGVKGMKIHIDFTAHNVNGHTIRPCVYFYDSNKVALVDSDGSYKTVDGKVSTSETAKSVYDDCRWRNFTIFFPYSQLHVGSGYHSLYFSVGIYDDTEAKWLLSSTSYYSFTYDN